MKKMLAAALAVLSMSLGAAVPQGGFDTALPGSRSNLSCGIPPIPPIGCKTGPCVCDQTGQNCQWTFICG